MSMAMPLAIYRPGSSPLHRLGVGPKLAGLAVASVLIVGVRGWVSAVGFVVMAAGLAMVARPGWRTVLRQTRGILLISVVIAAFQLYLSGVDRAVESLLDLVSLALLALVVTATTPVNAMIDAIVRWLRPVPFVDAEQVALLLALAVRALPSTIELAQETRDAAIARGLGRSPRAHVAPFVVRVVASAQHTGDALAARGLGDADTAGGR